MKAASWLLLWFLVVANFAKWLHRRSDNRSGGNNVRPYRSTFLGQAAEPSHNRRCDKISYCGLKRYRHHSHDLVHDQSTMRNVVIFSVPARKPHAFMAIPPATPATKPLVNLSSIVIAFQHHMRMNMLLSFTTYSMGKHNC